jgi:hypothetical protein
MNMTSISDKAIFISQFSFDVQGYQNKDINLSAIERYDEKLFVHN